MRMRKPDSFRARSTQARATRLHGYIRARTAASSRDLRLLSSYARIVSAKLPSVKARVGSFRRQQISVSAFFDDAPAINDDDTVRAKNCTQSVRDDERRPAL